ncbi:MAG: T9SS type A sorting domain-containing protein [Aliifodinibius sp.]|nr:T9SS type A sorting domain-containing protein [Fodinibius sp.]NIV15446.1 T9SS type A sorting domain-containing protein [Fodinibius sp.]NIY29295.1 T9SS type A sorting domain-containing protein [Fodinibius sp.]
MNRQFKYFAFIFLSSLIFSLSSFSQQYWVSPTGSDSTGDGSQTNPWRHINYAIQQIGVNNQVRQRILNVLPGVYAPSTIGEVFPIEMIGNLWLKGTDSSNTILDAENTELAIRCWKTKNVKITDLKIRNGIFPGNPGNLDVIGGISCRDGAEVEIFNCVITACEGGIFSANNTQQYKDSATFVSAHDNVIKNSQGNGIKVTGGDLLCENNVFDGNNSGLATGSAISTIGGAYRVPHIEIRNNIIKNGISKGGAIFVGRRYVLIEGNLIFNNRTQGGFNNGGGGGIFAFPVWNDTCIIRDNIIVGNTSLIFGGGISILIHEPWPQMDFRVQRNVIAYNIALGKGGAIGVHNGNHVIVGGESGMGNDIFKNTGADSVNLFYHDGPFNEQTMNFQYNYLGSDPDKYSLYSEPDSLFDISNYSDSMLICGQTVNCDSILDSLGITGITIPSQPEIAEGFKLYPNYPNPFNPSTMIQYELFQALKVRLRIFDLLGQKVTELLNKRQVPGDYTVEWNGTNSEGKQVGSGVYFYHFQIGKNTRVGKMILIR